MDVKALESILRERLERMSDVELAEYIESSAETGLSECLSADYVYSKLDNVKNDYGSNLNLVCHFTNLDNEKSYRIFGSDYLIFAPVFYTSRSYDEHVANDEQYSVAA